MPKREKRKTTQSALASRIARSKAGRAVVMPYRISTVAKVSGRTVRESARWLANSREYVNYTYPLTELSRKQLASFVALVADIDFDTADGYMDELEHDEELLAYLREARLRDPQWRLSDPEPEFGRRLGWYALTRALKPQHVVETGTDKGLGSMVFAAALLRNGTGRVTTVDVQKFSGYLIGGKWAEVIDRRLDDSHDVLPTLTGVDIFLHDSLHTIEHETRELELIAAGLTPGALLLSDTAHHTDVLLEWARRNRAPFYYYREQPAHHWYPGAGLGVSRVR